MTERLSTPTLELSHYAEHPHGELQKVPPCSRMPLGLHSSSSCTHLPFQPNEMMMPWYPTQLLHRWLQLSRKLQSQAKEQRTEVVGGRGSLENDGEQTQENPSWHFLPVASGSLKAPALPNACQSNTFQPSGLLTAKPSALRPKTS